MISVSVAFGPANLAINFLFKTHDAAEQAKTAIEGVMGNIVESVSVKDHFGQSATFRGISLHAVWLEDLDMGQEAIVERTINNARSQTKAQSRAASDPVLRFAAGNGAHGPMLAG